jgi:hypothetical protein
VSPPPALESEATAFAELVRIGFPARKHFDVPIFTYDGDTITTSSVVYVCPNCHSRVMELPTQCPVCGLQLVMFLLCLFVELLPAVDMMIVVDSFGVVAACLFRWAELVPAHREVVPPPVSHREF